MSVSIEEAILPELDTKFNDLKEYVFGAAQSQQIHATISRRAGSEQRGAFASTFEGEAMDSSLLLLVEVGFLEALAGVLRGVEASRSERVHECHTPGRGGSFIPTAE